MPRHKFCFYCGAELLKGWVQSQFCAWILCLKCGKEEKEKPLYFAALLQENINPEVYDG